MSTLRSDIWFWVYHSLCDPGNVLATVLICGPSAFFYHRFVIKPQQRLLKDIHGHVRRTEQDEERSLGESVA